MLSLVTSVRNAAEPCRVAHEVLIGGAREVDLDLDRLVERAAREASFSRLTRGHLEGLLRVVGSVCRKCALRPSDMAARLFPANSKFSLTQPLHILQRI